MISARLTRHAGLACLALAFLVAPPLHAQGAARYLNDLETMESKFTELAEAMESDSYSWRPMEGVRSVSEVYMLIVTENYMVPSSWGAEAPEGIEVGPALFQTMPEVTEKEEVVSHLRKSFEYCVETVRNLSDEQLDSTIQFFGRERTVEDAIFIIMGDMHEHLGQAIAYARMNQVVPPWTARAEANN
jgi:uncharacterized damage-inducible protein DinB